MAKTGRPPEFADTDEFLKRLDWYEGGFFKWCDDNEYIYLFEWLAVYLEIGNTTLCKYMKIDGTMPNGEYDNKQDFAKIIKRLGARILANLIQKGLLQKYSTPLTIFYMKNFGYTDVQEVKADMTVTLQIDGNGLFD